MTRIALPVARSSLRPSPEGERAALTAKARVARRAQEVRDQAGLESAAGVLEGLVGEAVAAQAEPEVEVVEAVRPARKNL